MNVKQSKIAVIGLGYVGLPLAVEFSKKFQVVGFDINSRRIGQLNKGYDRTLEVSDSELKSVLISSFDESERGFKASDSTDELIDCNVYVITVPTPTDKNNHPVLTPLIKASKMVGKVLKKEDVVIYESTVYPGATEDECVPVLEEASGLTFNKDFFVGYSPERINPGDKEHTVTKIKKVTSGSTVEVGRFVDALYKEIIVAGTHLAATIKIAEAAKVIENSQRDINIAFVNELSKIFNLLEIDTQEVLEAAGTKWNFLPFKPGLVGGHCIGVDPYYLAQKAQEVGYHPEIILAGRRINDSMGKYVAAEVIKCMIRRDIKVIDAKVLMLGITFKENCPDIRNTKAIDIYTELCSYDMNVDVFDPWADPEEVRDEYGISILDVDRPNIHDYSAIILAVSHNEFLELSIQKDETRVVFDVKGFLNKKFVDKRL